MMDGDPSAIETDPRPRGRLAVVKAWLVIFVVGLAVSNGLPDAWPLVGWPMYSGLIYTGPPTKLTIHELRIIDAAGETHTLESHELLTENETMWTETLSRDAAEAGEAHDADRRLLVTLAEARIGTDVTRLEIVRLTWAVDHTVTPPYDREAPDRREPLGTIVVDGETTAFRPADAEATP